MKDLKLTLNARGNDRQLAEILEEAARKIRASASTAEELPWFSIVSGSVTFDWRVERQDAVPNVKDETRR